MASRRLRSAPPARLRPGPQPSPDPMDPTRRKLLDAASQVFGECGFQAATIREICSRAGANVAAVNYHFGDKLGLYLEVLQSYMLSREGTPPAPPFSKGQDPEQALRGFISEVFSRTSSPDGPVQRLRIMAHEMAQPSSALHDVVDQVIRPNYDRLREIIGRIIGRSPDDDATRLCAHSVIGQVVHYAHARPVIAILWPNLGATRDRREQIANHIAEFSLCALRELAKKATARP